MVAQLNVNSLKNKFYSLKETGKDDVDILLIAETNTMSPLYRIGFYVAKLSDIMETEFGIQRSVTLRVSISFQ